MDIRSDRQKGLSYVELGRKYHMDPRTAKRYAESPQKPEYTLSEPKPTKMDPYKQIVDEWLEEAPYSALRILEKLREMGFNGGYSIVKAYVSSRKMDLNEKATVRFETMPGKQGQMDWGFFEDHLVYEDGKWKKFKALGMTQGGDVDAALPVEQAVQLLHMLIHLRELHTSVGGQHHVNGHIPFDHQQKHGC